MMQTPLNTAYAPSETLVVSRNKVLRNTYLMLALTLIPTMVGAMLGINLSFAFMRASPLMSALGMMAVIYGLFFAVEKNRNNSLGVALLLGLTFVMGVLLGPLLQVALKLSNGAQLVGVAAGGTAITFFVLAGIASSGKRDFSNLSKFLTVGAVVLMLAVVANLFLQLPALHLTLCAGFILFSSALILYQVNDVVNGGETSYVSATLSIYVSLYNIFTSLLQLLMAFGGDRD